VGKTTLLQKVIQKSDASFYGILSQRFQKGYYVTDIQTGETRILCSTDPVGIKIRRFYFDPQSLAFIERSLQRTGDILIYDEIGWMETESAFDIWKYMREPALLIVRQELVDMVSRKFPVTLFTVTEDNRDIYVNILVEKVSHMT